MKQSKLNLSFSKFTDDSLAIKAESILQMMTGNPDFPTPVPPLTDLEASITAYRAALVDAATNDKVKVAFKREARAALEGILVQLGMYVMYLSNGADAMLTSSGYDLSKQPEPTSLEQPGTVSLRNGITSGELVARLKKVKGAYSYLHQITQDPYTAESIWQSQPAISSSNTFEGLLPGQKYWIRVGAVGAGSQLAFSPAASQIAQ